MAANKIPVRLGKLSRDPKAGFQNTKLFEKQPEYNVAECETVYAGGNNTRIILGRDRDSHIGSGYGGKGHTRSGAIDIVVGLQGWDPASGGKGEGENFEPGVAEKNFGSLTTDAPGDAARIYISQRANIDQYFDICEGGVGMSVADSAIGLKADSIRIMSRKGIKLVTGKNPPGRNSLGGKVRVVYGIDLIAGNIDKDTGKFDKLFPKKSTPGRLQPIPKGDNLASALEWMSDRISSMNEVLSDLVTSFDRITQSILETRTGSNAGGPVEVFGKSGIVQIAQFNERLARYATDLSTHRKRMNAFKFDYLNISGENYINSRHNRTN